MQGHRRADVRTVPLLRRRLFHLLCAVLASVSAVAVLPILASPASAVAQKITICHRTHSTTNPYRKITVSQNAVSGNSGHQGHTAISGNPATYDSGFDYSSSSKSWGDVIPGNDSDGSPYNGISNSLNWDTNGKANFLNRCVGMTAKAFYDVESAAGVSDAAIAADLNSQEANEDVALLAALGGSFTTGNLGQWETAVSVTTSAATSVADTGAVLNGSLTVGSTSTMATFE